MGEDEVKGTMRYYDMNLGEWRELAKTTEVPKLVMTTEQVEDARYLPILDTSQEFTGTVELSDISRYIILAWWAYDKLIRALWLGDRRKIKRAKRNWKKAKRKIFKGDLKCITQW